MTAALALGEALGIEALTVAEWLPPIEAAMVRAVRRRQQQGHQQEQIDDANRRE